ncbi:MAG: NAD(P)/FAD-dependent oxidoreductase [Pseudomonadota bacterium]
MTERHDAIVVGGGHNGLTTATYLARAGLKTIVLESADKVGGMAAEFVIGGHYRFPGLATVTHPIGRALVDELRLDRYGYRTGEPIRTTALDKSGQHLLFDSSSASGETLNAADAKAYAFLKSQYRDFSQALQPLFFSKPPRLKGMDRQDKATMTRLAAALRVRLGRDGMYEFLRVIGMNIRDILDEVIENDLLKGAIAAEAVMGSAMGPRTPGTVSTWLHWLRGELDGPLMLQQRQASAVTALTDAAGDASAVLRTGARVRRILVKTGKATGVELSTGETVHAPIVVSNVDPRQTFTKLVGPRNLDAMFAHRANQVRGAGVVAKLLLALSGRPTFSGLSDSQLGGRLIVASSADFVEHAFNHSKYGRCSERFVLDIAIPSVADDSLAPPGHHVMSVNVAFVPAALKGGWKPQRQQVAEKVLDQLCDYAPGLRSLVQHQQALLRMCRLP